MADPTLGSLFFLNVTQINKLNISTATDIAKEKDKQTLFGLVNEKKLEHSLTIYYIIWERNLEW